MTRGPRLACALLAVLGAVHARAATRDVVPQELQVETSALRVLEDGRPAEMRLMLQRLAARGLHRRAEVREALERRRQRLEIRLLATGEIERAGPVLARHEILRDLRARLRAALERPCANPEVERWVAAATAELVTAWRSPVSASFGPDFADAQRDYAESQRRLATWIPRNGVGPVGWIVPDWLGYAVLVDGVLTVRSLAIGRDEFESRGPLGPFPPVACMSASPEDGSAYERAWIGACREYRAMLGLPAIDRTTLSPAVGRASAWIRRVAEPTLDTVAGCSELRRALADARVTGVRFTVARDQVQCVWRTRADR